MRKMVKSGAVLGLFASLAMGLAALPLTAEAAAKKSAATSKGSAMKGGAMKSSGAAKSSGKSGDPLNAAAGKKM